MIDQLTLVRWFYWLLLISLAGASVFVRLLPVGSGSAGWPGPDLLLCLVFAWVHRRPDFVPVLLVAALFLVTDMLFLRPPGLWTALVILGLEFLRGREPLSRELPFLVEWGMVAAVMVAMLVANRLVLGLFVVEQASLGRSLMQMLVTLVAYPLVALVSVHILRVRRLQPGEGEGLRRRA